jgi:hypothetical protein
MSELLARLNAKGTDLIAIRGSGEIALTPGMISAACRGLTRHMYLYALRKHADDESTTPELVQLNRIAVRQRAALEKWARVKASTVDQFADLTLFDSISTNHCGKCKGSGNSSLGVTCSMCRGTGKAVPVSMTEKGQIIGVSKQAYRNTWRSREQAIASEFQYFDEYVDKRIKRQVFGE